MIKTDQVIAIVDQGVFTPLNQYLERDGYSVDIWVPSEITGAQWDGETWGLPMRAGGASGNILYYNRAHFARSSRPGTRTSHSARRPGPNSRVRPTAVPIKTRGLTRFLRA